MIKAAISPCPNDTFLFYGWAENKIEHPLKLDLSFFDIEKLNNLATAETFALIKLSCATLGKLRSKYDPLPIGAALGFNQGPKLITKKLFPLKKIQTKTIAFPGRGTTAHLLFQDLFPSPKKKVFCLYHEILDSLDKVDAAVIIHESRFTFLEHGFYELADLGKLYSEKYSLPLALGALALRKDIHEKALIIDGLTKSLQYAKKNPQEALEFVLKYSQEKNLEIIQKHIALYVNHETESLSLQGSRSLEKIFELSEKYETVSICPSY